MNFLNILLPLLYALVFLVYMSDFFRSTNKISGVKRVFLFITLVIHSAYLLIRTIQLDHTPITNAFEIMTMLAFSISCSYFILESLTDIRGTGMFIILISLIFQVVSSIFIQNVISVPEILRSRLLGLHVFSGLIGYSAISISAVYGMLYYLLYKEIKLSRFGVIFDRLPNLELLEKLSFNASVIGLVFLSFTIVIGIIWLPRAFPDFNGLDPKLISTALVWCFYTAGVMVRIFAGWRGKKVVVFSIIGFLIAVISVLAANFLPYGFHTFN